MTDRLLELVVPNGGRPKGLVRYSPRAGRKIVAARIMDVLERMRASDALPIGPRAVGYRLKELYPGEYTKALEHVVAEEETEREDIRSRLNEIADAIGGTP